MSKKEKINSSSSSFDENIFKSNDGMFVCDNQGKVILLNEVAKKVWGITDESLKGADYEKLTKIASKKARDSGKFWEMISEVSKSKNTVLRTEISLTGGRVVDCHTFPMVGADNKIHGRIWYTRDITEQKRIQDLRNLQHLMMENLAEGVVLISESDSKILYSNKRFENIFGYNRNELIGKCICVLNAKDIEKSPEEINKSINEYVRKDGEWHGVVKNVKKDGTEIWTDVKTVGINHSQYGDVFVSIQEDITEKKVSERKLIESAKRYRVMFENSREAIMFISQDGVVLDANPAAQRILGYSLGDLKKADRASLFDTSDDRIANLMTFRSDRLAYYRGGFRIIRRDGRKVECEGTSVVFEDKLGCRQIHIVFHEV